MDTPIKVKKLMEYLKDKTGYASLDGKRTEIITLCPWCEWERFNKPVNHGHCYINIHDLRVNCFRCEEGRTYFPKLAKMFGIKLKDYLEDGVVLRDWSKHVKTRKTKKEFDVVNYNFKEIDETKYKLKRIYLLGRLGFDTELNKVPGLILSIKNFITENKLVVENRVLNIIDYLENNFVGFVTNRGSTIVLRNIDSTSDFRYYKIFLRKNIYFKDFYGIKTSYIKPKKNRIVLTEGIFDLLIPFRNSEFNDLKKDSCIWAACLGNSYKNMLLSVLDYCKIVRADVSILADNDTPYSYFEQVYKSPFVNSLEIYWNRYSKDFGDLPLDIVKKKFNYEDCKFKKGKYYGKKRNKSPYTTIT
jgi:hypothetical protein